MRTLWKVLTRRKVLTPDDTHETPLARVLNTFDLTALGVGSTLGVGVYVLAGQVARNTAGPAVIISFLIAAVASVFAGLCYAEFGARAPRAGSAYIYSYLCVGEFIAFVIGWNLILEYIIGSASVAKGMSSYIDNLWNGTLSRTFSEIAPINLPYLSPYFDFFAFVVPVLLSVALSFGMKESSLVNNIFTTLNICVVLFVIIAGSLNAHLSNWFIDPNDVKNATNGTDLGRGGFFPFGIDGVIKGAATCFYGFVGFDCIATTGEEVKNPKKAIPISIVLSLTIIFLAYFGTSTVITLMVPYYAQDPTAPIPFAFQSIHWHTAALIVSIGAIFGLYASLFGAMFPLPRILYAMASDGLIFKILGQVNETFKTPIIGTLCAGFFTGLMAALFDLEALVNMMSIGTLLAYTIVAASVLLLRYSEDEKTSYVPVSGSSDSEDIEGYSDSPNNVESVNESDDNPLTEDEAKSALMGTIFNCGKAKVPNKTTELIVSIDICIYCILCFFLGLCALHLKKEIMNREILPLTGISLILLLMVLTILSVLTQPLSRKVLSFQVPWVPLIPAVSMLFNIYLMIMLDITTWIRFVVWMILGILIFYFSRRNLSKNHKMVATENSNQGYANKNFYDEDVENVVNLDCNDPFFEPIIINHGGKPNSGDDPHIIDDSRILTPTKVIESLDLVLDSFIGDLASPDVMSIENVSLASNVALTQSSNLQSDNYRGTQNTVLRSKLLDALNIEYLSMNIKSAVVNPTYICEQSQLNENNFESFEKKSIEIQKECEVSDNNRTDSNIKLVNVKGSELIENCDDNSSHRVVVGNERRFSNMKDEHDDYLTHGVIDEKEVHPPNAEANSIDKCVEDCAINSDNKSSQVTTLRNIDGDQNENWFIPPPPPIMPDFKSFTSPVEDKFDAHNSDNQKDVSALGTLDRKSLGAVKLRHVEKSNLEKIAIGNNNSEGDHSYGISKDDSAETIFTPPTPPSMTNFNITSRKEKTESSSEKEVPVPIGKVRIEQNINLPVIDKSSLKLVKLRHVSRPSLEGKFMDTEDTVQTSHSLPDTPILGQSSRKTELTKENNISENENHLNDPRKIEISKDALNALKLRPINRPLSVNKSDQDQKPDAVRFGSLEFEHFRRELNEKLKNPSISRVPSFFDPKTVNKRRDIKVKNENVIEDNIDIQKAKATIQLEIESKLNILKGHEDLKNNVVLKERPSETFNPQINIQNRIVSDVDERPPVEIKD